VTVKRSETIFFWLTSSKGVSLTGSRRGRDHSDENDDNDDDDDDDDDDDEDNDRPKLRQLNPPVTGDQSNDDDDEDDDDEDNDQSFDRSKKGKKSCWY
jgi:hypothetical protein